MISLPDPDRTSRRKFIKNIAESAWYLERGEKVQVTRLRPLGCLAGNQWNSKSYYYYLVESSYQFFQNGLSMSRVCLVDVGEKEKMYADALKYLKILYEDHEGIIKVGKALIDLYEQINQLSPGNTWVSKGRCRRKLRDPDLVLLEQTIRFSLNSWYGGYWSYSLAKYYCCNYWRYRYILDRQSFERVMGIAEFFSQKYFYVPVRHV
jgi:hypothetical protein